MMRPERVQTRVKNRPPSIQPTAVAVPLPNLRPRTTPWTRRPPRQFAFFPFPASLDLQHATPAMVMDATKVRAATSRARVNSPAFRHPIPRRSTHLAIILGVRFVPQEAGAHPITRPAKLDATEYAATTASAAPRARSVSVSLPTPISARSGFAEFRLKTRKMMTVQIIVCPPAQAAHRAMTSAVAIAMSGTVTNLITLKRLTTL